MHALSTLLKLSVLSDELPTCIDGAGCLKVHATRTGKTISELILEYIKQLEN